MADAWDINADYRVVPADALDVMADCWGVNGELWDILADTLSVMADAKFVDADWRVVHWHVSWDLALVSADAGDIGADR